jgi:hypothetical protein
MVSSRKGLLRLGFFGVIATAVLRSKRRKRLKSVADAAPTTMAAPATHTSPHTAPDYLEARRAREAAVRERESRESTDTKFEELRKAQEAEGPQHAELGAPPRAGSQF